MSKPHVGIIMGSDSDYDTMKHAEDILKAHDIPYEIHVVSAHRMGAQWTMRALQKIAGYL